MKLHINIAEDMELRTFIKEQVRGAVKAVTREEMLQGIVAELTAKVRGSNTAQITKIIEEETRKEIRSKLAGSQWGAPGELHKVIREEVRAGLAAHFSKGVI